MCKKMKINHYLCRPKLHNYGGRKQTQDSSRREETY